MLEQSFQKAKVVTGKNFVLCDRYILYSPFYLLNMDSREGSFICNVALLILALSTTKLFQFFEKVFQFSEKLFQS